MWASDLLCLGLRLIFKVCDMLFCAFGILLVGLPFVFAFVSLLASYYPVVCFIAVADLVSRSCDMLIMFLFHLLPFVVRSVCHPVI